MSFRTVLDDPNHYTKSGGKLSPPSWLRDNLIYESIMGSDAYAMSSGDSDTDVYGVCIPPKGMILPHIEGEIPGFGRQVKRFDTWQEHHIQSQDKELDFQIYGIVKFFQLAMENNPNILDSMFTPRRCVLSSTALGEYIRENRTDFLHKGAWHKFKGYSYAQMNQMTTKKPAPDTKRAALVEKYGFDTKYAVHLVRLLLEVEQILVHKDINLERDSEQLKGIRRGDWTLEQVQAFFHEKEKSLEALYHSSTIPYGPDEPLIRKHLMHCLEHHYGNLSSVVASPGEEAGVLKQIAMLTEKYRG